MIGRGVFGEKRRRRQRRVVGVVRIGRVDKTMRIAGAEQWAGGCTAIEDGGGCCRHAHARRQN